jgi:hypothetical protein
VRLRARGVSSRSSLATTFAFPTPQTNKQTQFCFVCLFARVGSLREPREIFTRRSLEYPLEIGDCALLATPCLPTARWEMTPHFFFVLPRPSTMELPRRGLCTLRGACANLQEIPSLRGNRGPKRHTVSSSAGSSRCNSYFPTRPLSQPPCEAAARPPSSRASNHGLWRERSYRAR